MNTSRLRAASLGMIGLMISAVSYAEETTEAAWTITDNDSYSMGVDFGRVLSRQPLTWHIPDVIQGFSDALYQQPLQLDDDTINKHLTDIQNQMIEAQMEQFAKQAEENAEISDSFFEQNALNDNIQSTASGLQYEMLRHGEGKRPALQDTVTVHYRGTLLDGTEFDSSIARGEPVSFQVSGVIAGWTEALLLMPVGSQWKLYIPPALAYGEHGIGGVIPPNAALIFEVELLSIE